VWVPHERISRQIAGRDGKSRRPGAIPAWYAAARSDTLPTIGRVAPVSRVAFVLRLLGRDWRAGELRLLLAALLIAVGTVTAISLTVDRLGRALLSESSTFLAADRLVASGREIPEAFDAAARRLGVDTARTLTFASMVFAGDRNQLVSVKAVSPGYPLRGVVRVADEPFGKEQITTELPGPGEAWLDARVFPALGIAVGARIHVGVAELTVTQVLAGEPDRGGNMFDFGPRLLMRLADVEATGVVQPGSRIYHRLLFRGDDSALAALEAWLVPELAPGYRWQSIREASPSIGDALARAESFLLLGGLLAVLLAGVAVALGAHRYARRHYDHVAILKTLGATPSQIQWGYLGLLLALAGLAVPLGLALGGGIHLAIVQSLSSFLPLALPAPGAKPLVVGAVTGFVCLNAFALPPVLALRAISPMRVIRRDLSHLGPSAAVTYGSAAVGSLLLLVWYTGSVKLTLWTLGGVVGVAGLFGGLALLLLRGGHFVGMQAGSRWRLALAALLRRRNESIVQVLIFGLAIMLLLILWLLRTALLDEWRAQLPVEAPNHFLMNVTSDQLVPVQRLLDENTVYSGVIYPMIRGRIRAVNGIDLRDWRRRAGSEDGPSGSERNLSFARDLPANNRVVAGQWWSGPGPYISLEAEFAREGGFGVGDELEFDVAGAVFAARVTNIRTVEWDSMEPNFFVLFAPGVLEEFAATWMTSFHLPPGEKRFLNRLLSEFPTVSVIEVDEIIAQIQSIVARVTDAVQLVLVLVLASGCLVLVASIQASRDERLAEHALLRALGASSVLIRGALAVEFAVLGAFAGVVAAVGAEVTVRVLSTEVFRLPSQWHPELWLLGPFVGIAVVAGCGLLGTRSLVRSPPIRVLRALG
jgi:putative ABC transport system permease protein